MKIPDYEISPAVSEDIPAIFDLQERNLRVNGGALSVRFSRLWFSKAITEMPIIVARKAKVVVGYVVSTSFNAQKHDPIVRAMLQAYPGSSGSYIYGPICVAKDHRGQGLAVAMFEQLKARLPEREGITFIRRDNLASIGVHIKMGMREVAAFNHRNVGYVVVAYV